MAKVNSFRYRVEDAFRAVTKASVREARLKELKSDILKSEKLKSHFDDNPTDMDALKHDHPLHPARIQEHMRHIPVYLLPKKGERAAVNADETSVGQVNYKPNRKRAKPNPRLYQVHSILTIDSPY